MWFYLYQLASPKSFYRLTGRLLFPLGTAAFCLLLTGIFWGLFLAPPDYQQGDAFRIIYVHVPSAFLSMGIYTWMAFLSLLLLVWRIKIAGLLIRFCAQTGFSMALLALVTGSIWGKPMWGTWWVWDARLTSELVLLLLYAAILATGSACRNPRDGDRLMAILVLAGLVDLPIIHYSVYWWNSLHQGATLSVFARPKIDAPMLYPLLISLGGFSLFALWHIFYRGRMELLWREREMDWVQQLFKKGCA